MEISGSCKNLHVRCQTRGGSTVSCRVSPSWRDSFPRSTAEETAGPRSPCPALLGTSLDNLAET
jgi:hypothetical protein